MNFWTRLNKAVRRATQFHHNVYLIWICTFFFGFLIFGGIFQVLVNLVLVRLGYGPEFVGLLNGVGLLSLSLGSITAALLGQRYSSTSLLRLGYSCYVIGLLLFPVGTYFAGTLQRSWMLVTYSIGFFMGAIFAVHMNPLMMLSTTESQRNDAFSYQMAIMTFGGFVGATVAGGLSSFFVRLSASSAESPTPYTWTLFSGALLALIGVVAAFFLKDVSVEDPEQISAATPQPEETTDPFPWKIILTIALVISLRIVGESAARNFTNLYLDIEFSVEPSQIAYIYSVAQFLAIPASLLAPVLMTRFGRVNVFNWATIGVSVFVITSAFAPGWLLVTVSYVFILGLAQIARPAITIISMESVSPRWRSSMSSSNIISIGIAGLVTALAGGLMIGSVGFTAFFVAAAAVTFAGVAVFYFNFARS